MTPQIQEKMNKKSEQKLIMKNFSVGKFSTFYLYFVKIYCEIIKITILKHRSRFKAN